MTPVQLTVSAGSGPREARIFALRLADELVRWLSLRGMSLIDRLEHGAADAPSSVDLRFGGAPAALSDLLGTHALVARSEARSKRARKRWYVGVSLGQSVSGAAAAVRAEELRFVACRARGPGGQHVNRTESAVLLTHLPSGVTLRVESERSQHRNRAIAIERLQQLLVQRARDAQADTRSERRLRALHVERGRAVHVWRCDGERLVHQGAADAP